MMGTTVETHVVEVEIVCMLVDGKDCFGTASLEIDVDGTTVERVDVETIDLRDDATGESVDVPADKLGAFKCWAEANAVEDVLEWSATGGPGRWSFCQ